MKLRDGAPPGHGAAATGIGPATARPSQPSPPSATRAPLDLAASPREALSRARESMILLAHSYFLAHDRKQLARMKPYPPLATLLAAATVRREGHDVALFDAMLAPDTGAFVAALDATRPEFVAIVEDNFNFLTKMCTVRMREATIEMIRAARAAGCPVVVNGSDASDHPARYLDAGA